TQRTGGAKRKEHTDKYGHSFKDRGICSRKVREYNNKQKGEQQHPYHMKGWQSPFAVKAGKAHGSMMYLLSEESQSFEEVTKNKTDNHNGNHILQVSDDRLCHVFYWLDKIA